MGHHLLIFGLFGVLFAELVVVRKGVTQEAVARIAAVDLWYGILAGLNLIVGFSRAVFAAKGWAYYSHNSFFLAKMVTFALVGVLSIPPTMAFIRWRRATEAPTDAQVRRVRLFLLAEVHLFLLLPIFAAAMARGYGDYR